MLILGVGPFVGELDLRKLGMIYKIGDKLQYSSIFQYSMGAAFAGAILLAPVLPPTEARK